MNLNQVFELFGKEDASASIHIHCTQRESDLIIQEIDKRKQAFGIVFQEDALYESLKVKDYLKFFDQLAGSRKKLNRAVSWMYLQELLNTRIYLLSYSEKRRLAIAREIIKSDAAILIQEPIQGIDEESGGYIMKWMEAYTLEGKKILTTSESMKSLMLLEGDHYSLKRGELVRMSNVHKNFAKTDYKDLISGDARLMLNHKLKVQNDGKEIYLTLDQVDYIEKISNVAMACSGESRFRLTASMDTLERTLRRYGFLRCHDAYLVNMQKAETIIRWSEQNFSLRLYNSGTDIPLHYSRVGAVKGFFVDMKGVAKE